MANYFSLFLVVLTVASGLIWLIDAKIFAPKRRQKVVAANGGNELPEGIELPVPYVVDTAQQIFPVIAFVLVLRSFIYEPFQIPSGSMMPTLLVGDFILVEKFSYGLKDPVTRTKFFETGAPERGDVVVFKYPENPKLDYIKRVVGLPGDTISYSAKDLYIKPACASGENCAPEYKVERDFLGQYNYQGFQVNKLSEQLGDVNHEILIFPRRLDDISRYYEQSGTRIGEWVVPEGNYFVMGDNRDNSEDGRFWGFVSDDHLVGKAVAIWISFEFGHAPEDFLPTWIPTGVRFERVGGID
ncbi:signal peptidase I [Aliiglaciecola lipolytica]|uniref:Signal peptidase I n=1 Tax=Aliiglaciecola lipolytica E3 TaxID=1127673 RepID=K6YAA8_9ALTE|nr:signal peptidase I [Aliiglaciecola lipolytica]GAC15127.1 signal peptidase I [Aliiglaciecola lipolytica E3]